MMQPTIIVQTPDDPTGWITAGATVLAAGLAAVAAWLSWWSTHTVRQQWRVERLDQRRETLARNIAQLQQLRFDCKYVQDEIQAESNNREDISTYTLAVWPLVRVDIATLDATLAAEMHRTETELIKLTAEFRAATAALNEWAKKVRDYPDDHAENARARDQIREILKDVQARYPGVLNQVEKVFPLIDGVIARLNDETRAVEGKLRCLDRHR